MSSPVKQLREGVGAAEWQALSEGLSADALGSLAQLALAADMAAAKAALIRAVVDAIPEWGDRAVLVACSRVSQETFDAVIREDRRLP